MASPLEPLGSNRHVDADHVRPGSRLPPPTSEVINLCGFSHFVCGNLLPQQEEADVDERSLGTACLPRPPNQPSPGVPRAAAM